MGVYVYVYIQYIFYCCYNLLRLHWAFAVLWGFPFFLFFFLLSFFSFLFLLGAPGMHPVRDKVMGQERNLQGSSSSHGAAPGPSMSPQELPGRERNLQGSSSPRGCPGDKVTGREGNLQGSPSPRGCPGGPVCPFLPSVLLLLGFLLIFGNAHDCSGSGHDHKHQVVKERLQI